MIDSQTCKVNWQVWLLSIRLALSRDGRQGAGFGDRRLTRQKHLWEDLLKAKHVETSSGAAP
jgi:hypothetical protein